MTRRFPLYLSGRSLDRPSGWVVYDTPSGHLKDLSKDAMDYIETNPDDEAARILSRFLSVIEPIG